jgi:hypothetical protein
VGSLVTPTKGLSKPYEGTPADEVLQRTKAMAGARLGDPAKAAQRILEVVTGTGMGVGQEMKGCLRVVLGSDCMKVARGKWREFGETWILWRRFRGARLLRIEAINVLCEYLVICTPYGVHARSCYCLIRK